MTEMLRSHVWIFLRQRVNARPHRHAGHVVPPGTEDVHVQAVQPVKFLAGEAERMRGVAGL